MLKNNGLYMLLTAFLLMVFQPTILLASGGDGDEDWVQQTGDILQIALPVLGGGATFFTNPEPGKTWDREGTMMFVKSYGTAWGTTYLIKFMASKARPNGDNRTSFPSGHTMSAFAGAAFIDGRFGMGFGIPSYALALFTGFSRVHSGWHYRDDVLAGASIGMISNWFWTSPLPGKVQLIPTVDRHGYGLQMSIGGATGDSQEEFSPDNPRGAGYRFTFGPAFVISNTAGSQGAGDNQFKLSDLDGFNNPTTTAMVTVNVPISRRGSVAVRYGPFEARDQGTFSEDVNFGGSLFPAGTPLDSAWRFYDLNLLYNHVLANTPTFGLTGSAGAGVMYSYATLTSKDGSASSLVDDQTFYPTLSLNAEWRFTRHFAFGGYGGGMTLNDDWILDLGAGFIWRAAYSWDLALGYHYFSRKIETDTFFNEVNYNIPYLSISRFW